MLDTNSILLNFQSFLKYIFSVLFAKFFSARLLIVQCSQFVFVYIYIRHTLIAWVWFLWSHPQTTSHVELVQPESDQRKKIVRDPKWSRVLV